MAWDPERVLEVGLGLSWAWVWHRLGLGLGLLARGSSLVDGLGAWCLLLGQRPGLGNHLLVLSPLASWS